MREAVAFSPAIQHGGQYRNVPAHTGDELQTLPRVESVAVEGYGGGEGREFRCLPPCTGDSGLYHRDSFHLPVSESVVWVKCSSGYDEMAVKSFAAANVWI